MELNYVNLVEIIEMSDAKSNQTTTFEYQPIVLGKKAIYSNNNNNGGKEKKSNGFKSNFFYYPPKEIK